MDTEHTQTQPRIEFWMREHSPSIHDRQQATLAQLQELDESGHIDTFSVEMWDKHLATATNESPAEITRLGFDKAHEFETWADQTGHSLHPSFRRHTQSSLVTDTSREVIIPPILCIAIYEGETLSEVVPHSGPDGHHTVTECLQSLIPNDDS